MNSWMFKLLVMTALVAGFPERSSAQITAESIAMQISAESGGSPENYRSYSERLAKTLYGLTPAARARVFGRAASVLLNDELGLEPINFANKSADLTADSRAELDKVAEFLRENPDARIMIEGHTAVAFSGDQALSENRALAAKQYLQTLGISGERIESAGYANTRPLVEGTSTAAQSQNRRIAIKVQ